MRNDPDLRQNRPRPLQLNPPHEGNPKGASLSHLEGGRGTEGEGGDPIKRRSLAAFAAALALAAALPADDRDLLGTAGEPPYVFIIFDVSGSMNWQPGGDLWAPGAGDDPNSKFYQAKSALFEVLNEPDLAQLQWGFATYNQDDLRAFRKHWLYTARTNPAWVTDDRLPYPKIGDPKFFGDRCQDDDDSNSDCDLDTDDTLGTCGTSRNVDDAEAWGEILSYPVLGDSGTSTTQEWVLHNNRRFRLTWTQTSGDSTWPDSITASLRLREANSSCTSFISDQTVSVVFDRMYTADDDGNDLPGSTDFLNWQIDSETDLAGAPNGFWNPDDVIAADGTCNGWEPNTDTGADTSASYLLKYPTEDDPLNRHATVFDRGDVVPFDWLSESVWGVSNRDAILTRLAPNFDPLDPAAAEPDFRVASYFEDHPNSLLPTGSTGRLALLSTFSGTPPLIPNGATPIGNSMQDFMEWFDVWQPLASDPEDGDSAYTCRTVNVVILSDGDETCYVGPQDGDTDGGGNANPCWIAEQLFDDRVIKTYIVGFGVQTAADNFLGCIARNGCTDDGDVDDDGVIDQEATKDCNGDGLVNDDDLNGPGPILPQNRADLVAALKEVFRDILAGASSFASAAVPSAQAEIADAIFLTSFIPVEDASVWDGHLDAFLRPLPLLDGKPDETTPCSAEVTARCHLWDAGGELVEQAPTQAEVDVGTFKLGTGADERRVYYAQEGTAGSPNPRLLFLPPASDADRFDLWEGMQIPFGTDPDDPLYQEAEDRSTAAVKFTLRRKEATVDTGGGPVDITYVLGDVFHSNPVYLGAPDRFEYWVADLYGEGEPCEGSTPDPGYRCFFERHQFRRKTLLTGSNDGELHAFDAGIFKGSVVDGEIDGDFDNGTGRELFAYIPRMVLPTIVQLAEQPLQDWAVDGTLRSDDAFIDPVHAGSPNAGEREWRTVAIGGLREGGKLVDEEGSELTGRTGYFALDLTQPDLFDADGLPEPLGGTYVPSCTDGGTGCGPLPFPAVLWEFTDTRDEDAEGTPGHGFADLGATWSVPNTGRVRVCEGTNCDPADPANDLADTFVAVVGGGMDPEKLGRRGNWLYMIDIETGKSIYKRDLSGSAPSEPAAVDTDQDGYLDTIYIGTTDGLLYKADIGTPAPLEDVLLGDGTTEKRVIDPAWEPFAIFDAGGRPIYLPPAVVFVAELGRYAVAFGTGEREDLWATTGQEGRFYMILDDGFTSATAGLPRDETSYQQVAAVGQEDTGTDFLTNPLGDNLPGWFITLGTEERVITTPFALSGITIFTSFVPDVDEAACSSGGESRIFVVFTTSANAVLDLDADGDGDEALSRFWTVEGFVTDPYTEQSTTKNVDSDGGGDSGEGLTDDLLEVMETLKGLFPDNCRFSSLRIDIKTVQADTGVFFIAPVPVCLVEKNWKEL